MSSMQPSRRALRTLRIAACASVLVVGATIAPPAGAEAELTVSPTIIEVDAEAGETITERLSVSAGADQAIVVELVHADFGFDDTSYQVTLIRDDAPETTAFSTRDWFSLPRERYRVPAGRTVELPLRIEVPENTPGGTYLGAALIRVVPADAAPGTSQVQAVPETGPLLFIAVEGGDPPRPALDRFRLPKVIGSGPIRPDIIVENRGDAFFTYEGTLRLTGPGKDDTVDVARQFVVPGQPRRLRTSPDDRGDAGRPELGSRSLGIGRYEVTARLRIEPTGRTLVATRTVWVIPMWARVLGVLVLLVVAGAVALLARWVLERRRLAPYLEPEGEVDRAGDDVDAAEDDEDLSSDEPDDLEDPLDHVDGDEDDLDSDAPYVR